MPPNPETVADATKRINEAALELFTSQGFHGTSMRDIAARAGVSLGSLYNHHETKDALFTALIESLQHDYMRIDTPLAKALASFSSLDDLESVGLASREMVRRFADFIRLIYVDVVELGGEHIRRLFGGMRARYEQALGERLRAMKRSGEIGDVEPVGAMMMATILYFYLFNIEHVFGVRRLFGVSDGEAIGMISRILREGMRAR